MSVQRCLKFSQCQALIPSNHRVINSPENKTEPLLRIRAKKKLSLIEKQQSTERSRISGATLCHGCRSILPGRINAFVTLFSGRIFAANPCQIAAAVQRTVISSSNESLINRGLCEDEFRVIVGAVWFGFCLNRSCRFTFSFSVEFH